MSSVQDTTRIWVHAAGRSVLAYIALTKPRIQLMLLFTAYCAMVIANRAAPDIRITIPTLAGLALSTGGSAAINMWYDRDIDAIMGRTSHRPIPTGQVKPAGALIFGVALMGLSFGILIVWTNVLTAMLSFLGAFYYAVVYTMWLKRRTPHNIVFGGGAGALPPLIGWTAITGHFSWPAWIMFGIIVLWTPPHFWSLALYKNQEYARAGIPMMPTVRGARSTKIQSLMYAITLVPVSLSLYLTGAVTEMFVWMAAIASFVFLWAVIRSWMESDDTFIWPKRTFLWSLGYLPSLFMAMVASIPH